MLKGIVIKTTGSWHTVKTSNNIVNCRLKGNFRIKGTRITNPVAVGDEVEIDQTGDTGTITKICKRENYIIRKSTNLSRESQILASNLDQVMLMFTLDYPVTPLEFVDRFLVAAEAYHIKTILIVNKIDMYDEDKLTWMNEVFEIYHYAGYEIFGISVKENTNIERLDAILKGKRTLLAGNSGIGKSSLINLLNPGLNLKTNDISWYHEAGKHTTTYPEMLAISNDTYIIDSPGIRGFGLTDLDKNEIGLYFTDIFKLSKGCQFYNCTHIHEPKCAVIEAYDKGILHESRYRSYVNIFSDNDQKYRFG